MNNTTKINSVRFIIGGFVYRPITIETIKNVDKYEVIIQTVMGKTIKFWITEKESNNGKFLYSNGNDFIWDVPDERII